MVIGNLLKNEVSQDQQWKIYSFCQVEVEVEVFNVIKALLKLFLTVHLV
jgi:hypothetical protein